MTLRHLEIFVEVYEQRSVTGAARQLMISQPSVSLTIHEVERQYGIRLFDRTGRKLRPTESAAALYQYATRILSQYRAMDAQMRTWGKEPPLRIGSTITIGNVLLPPLLSQWRADHPDSRVKLQVANAGTIEQGVLDATLDLGLMEGVVHHDRIVAEKFLEDHLTFICSKDSPLAGQPSVSLETFPTLDFIFREKGSGTRELIDSTLLVRGCAISPMWESVSTHAIIHLVAAGLGVSILPYRLVAPAVAAGQVVSLPVQETDFHRSFYLIYPVHPVLSPSALKFMEAVRAME